ncbi:MAG: MucR family transcriptional regulator [Hyphomonas oceanitis]|uniref:MucR family transcriptional regulator n=1 Tax=Hyphomonas oceanitis TaxID=81033 RepID=UPI003002AEB8
MSNIDDTDVLDMTASIVTSFVANNSVAASELPALIKTVHGTILDLSTGGAQPADILEPAVSIAKSVTPEYLVCLEDGRKLKMLKRYLRSRYDMTPEEYRARWNLPADYPMVAPNYAKLRSQHAKDIGLGKKRSTDT